MSKLDIINEEIIRRENSNIDFATGQEQLEEAIEQFNTLDEFYRTDEKASREVLECSYLESRHFSGEWPVVYSFAETERYPFYNGETDADCNPYFPITKAQDGSFDGLAPFPAPITRTGAYARQRTYVDPEPTLRASAMSVLGAYPDTSGETGDPYDPGDTLQRN